MGAIVLAVLMLGAPAAAKTHDLTGYVTDPQTMRAAGVASRAPTWK